MADRRGATAMEYALIAVLISVLIITGVTVLGSNLSSTFATLASKTQ